MIRRLLLPCAAALLLAAPLPGRTAPAPAPYNHLTDPLPTDDVARLARAGYRFAGDGIVLKPGTDEPVPAEEMPEILGELVSRQKLEAMLSLNLLFNRYGYKDLPADALADVRRIARDNWTHLPASIRADLRGYFTGPELQAMDTGVKPVKVPRTWLPGQEDPLPALADDLPAEEPLAPNPRPGRPLSVADTMPVTPLPAPWGSSAPAPAATTAASRPLPAPWATARAPLAAPPAATVAAVPAAAAPAAAKTVAGEGIPATWGGPPVSAPPAKPAAPAASAAPAAPTPAPVAALAAAAAVPAAAEATLAKLIAPPAIPAAAGFAAAAPQAPARVAAAAPAAPPVAPAVPAVAPAAPAAAPAAPAAASASNLPAAAPSPAPAPAPAPPPAPPKPAAPPFLEYPQTSPEAFAKFLADAPYGREAHHLLELISRHASPDDRRVALGVVQRHLPGVLIDGGRAGVRLRSWASLPQGELGIGKSVIVLHPGPAVVQRRKLFGGGDVVLVPEGPQYYSDKGLQAPALQAATPGQASSREKDEDWGHVRVFDDGSRRVKASPEQLAGTLLAELFRLDAVARGFDDPYRVTLRARAAQLRFYRRLAAATGIEPRLDRALAAEYSEWLHRPTDWSDHWVQALAAPAEASLAPTLSGELEERLRARAATERALLARVGLAPESGPEAHAAAAGDEYMERERTRRIESELAHLSEESAAVELWVSGERAFRRELDAH